VSATQSATLGGPGLVLVAVGVGSTVPAAGGGVLRPAAAVA